MRADVFASKPCCIVCSYRLYIASVFRLCVVTMVIRFVRFNSYLLGVVCVALLAGCQGVSKREKRTVATLRIHVETAPEPEVFQRTQIAKISRSNPIKLTVDKEPFLDESEITDAGTVDTIGGFAIVVSFGRRGSMLLEQYSATNPGRHLAVIAEWGRKPLNKRWLAAPVVQRRISEGRLGFTPDCTREEAEEIVRGLNHHAKSHPEAKKKKGE
jgi:hypothetical protein